MTSIGAPLPNVILHCIREFNERRYYECHETLEVVWRTERGQTKLMLHGMIQVAVGLLHLERGNYKGAVSLLERAIAKLEGVQPNHVGVDVSSLLADTRHTHATVLALGPSGIARFPWDGAPEIRIFTTKGDAREEETKNRKKIV